PQRRGEQHPAPAPPPPPCREQLRPALAPPPPQRRGEQHPAPAPPPPPHRARLHPAPAPLPPQRCALLSLKKTRLSASRHASLSWHRALYLRVPHPLLLLLSTPRPR